jgi:hypothetical protein
VPPATDVGKIHPKRDAAVSGYWSSGPPLLLLEPIGLLAAGGAEILERQEFAGHAELDAVVLRVGPTGNVQSMRASLVRCEGVEPTAMTQNQR